MPLCKVLAYIVQTCCWWLCSTVQKLALDSVVHDIRHLGRLPCFSAHEGDLQADHPRASGEEAWYGDKAGAAAMKRAVMIGLFRPMHMLVTEVMKSCHM
jgi:hypothetical protein